VQDKDAIAEILSGRQEPLRALMEKYNALLYRTLSRFCRIPHELEDLIQEIWVKAFFQLKKLKKNESFRSWLIRIAYHQGIDYLRMHRNEILSETMEEEPGQEKQEPYRPSFRDELEKMIWEELRDMKMKYQLPLILFFFEGFSYEEIQESIGVKLNTVKSLIRRGKEKLKAKLEAKGVKKWNI
jgi:RNA polymerase sigma-70 factor (ECF subfamily)